MNNSTTSMSTCTGWWKQNKGKTLKIKSERYKGYKHIYILNDLSFKDQTSLYKYMPYSRFVGSVRNEELVFVSPSL